MATAAILEVSLTGELGILHRRTVTLDLAAMDYGIINSYMFAAVNTGISLTVKRHHPGIGATLRGLCSSTSRYSPVSEKYGVYLFFFVLRRIGNNTTTAKYQFTSFLTFLEVPSDFILLIKVGGRALRKQNGGQQSSMLPITMPGCNANRTPVNHTSPCRQGWGLVSCISWWPGCSLNKCIALSYQS